MESLTTQIQRARGQAVALISISTADQPACCDLVNNAAEEDKSACIGWDVVRGPYPMNAAGQDALGRVLGQMDPSMATDFPAFAGMLREGRPEDVVVVAHNAHRLLQDSNMSAVSRNIQSIINLREPLAVGGSTLVLLAPAWTSPPELGSDVFELDDPLPSDAERETVARGVLEETKAQQDEFVFDEADVQRALRATRGLSRYAVEQTISLALRKAGLDQERLKARFISAVNAAAGMTYLSGRVPPEDICGLDNFKRYSQRVAQGREVPDLIVRLDEIEKMFGGASTDSTGVSQDALGVILEWMEDEKATGMLALGPPGSGKSMSSMMLGSVLDCPTVKLDLGATRNRFVGSSEQAIRSTLKTLKGLAKRTFWIGTCNKIESKRLGNETEDLIPPELRRRFSAGVWFFDLPSPEERAAIWSLYLKKFELGADAEIPNDDGWTGAEIKTACETAWRLRTTPKEAAQWIVPVSTSAAESITALRQAATGRYISASSPGPYQYTEVKVGTVGPRKRTLRD